jgi:gluconolactonase
MHGRALLLVMSALLAGFAPRPDATAHREPEASTTPAVVGVRAHEGDGEPAASIDLMTEDGIRLVQGQWRYSDVSIVEVAHKSVGPDNRPSGRPNRTYDISPHAGAATYDDRQWQAIPATSLRMRRSTGRFCFNWYRVTITVPDRIGTVATAGGTLVLELTADDYAEVWVDGDLPRDFGMVGGPLVAGWNAPNRLVVGRDIRPGQRIQIAVFAANGPLSDPPPNYIWLRTAKLDVYPAAPGARIRAGVGEIERLDPALDAVLPLNPFVAKLAGGFQFIEGPVWSPDGTLLFSDPNANRIYRYVPRDGAAIVLKDRSGFQGADVASFSQPGSNGLAFDPSGRLTIDEHGNRRVTRVEGDGSLTVLADRFEGKRLNSPNDLVYRSDGALYFTDPPFGLPKFFDDPRKELAVSGVFRWKDGTLQLLSTDLRGPNGIAFSPDERYLYVTNWDPARKVVMRYDVKVDGTLAKGRVFYDMAGAPGEEALDGLKIDALGNLYVSGPGGVWIISAEGIHLGMIRMPELPANFAWGDEDRRTLYMTARTGLYRMRMNVAGAGVRPRPQGTR